MTVQRSADLRPKTRIVFIINSIGSGGAERVLEVLLDEGLRYGSAEIHLILLDDLPRFRRVPDHVIQHQLDSRMKLGSSIKGLFKALRDIRPDVVVSFLVRANVANALLSKVLGYPAILLERMHLSSHLENYYAGKKLLVARLLPKLTYRFARRVSGVSVGVSEDLAAKFGVPEARLETIYNPFDMTAIEAKSREPVDVALPSSFIVAVGRLAKSKDYPTLIEAYRLAAIDLPLVILGEGAEEAALRRAVHVAGLEKRILMLGYVANPLTVVARAKFYVSASTNEGFPNALMEAMCLGVPVISTDCPSGPAEILDGVVAKKCQRMEECDAGILVPVASPTELAAAMNRMNDPAVAEHYAKKSRQRAHDFDSGQIVDTYWNLILSQARSRTR